jgi:hypothetical protein
VDHHWITPIEVVTHWQADVDSSWDLPVEFDSFWFAQAETLLSDLAIKDELLHHFLAFSSKNV